MNNVYNEIYSNEDKEPVINKLKAGVDKVANAVKSTLGPAGNTVIMDTIHAGVISTKDGVSVAKGIDLEDPIENVAATMIKSVAEKTVDEAGDGTTTATILAQALLNESIQTLRFIRNRNAFKRSIEKFAKQVVEFAQSHSTEITLDREGKNTELLNIAKISSNGDEKMAEIIVEAFKMVGEEGIITVDDGTQDGYTVEHIDGLRVDAGMAHAYFTNNSTKLECVQDNTCVVMMKGGVKSLQSLLPVLEDVVKNGKPITIFSDNFTEQVIQLALQNKFKSGININLIKVQGYDNRKEGIYEDIGAVTNARLIDETTKAEEILKYVGKATKIVSNKNETRIINENRDQARFDEHIETLNNLLNDTLNASDKEKIEDRISKLIGGVAIIKVGGKSKEQIHEIKDRLDDAVNAVRSTLEEGYVQGSGTIYYYASKMLKDDGSEGYKVMKKVLEAPLNTLCENTGYSVDYVKSLLGAEFNPMGCDFSANTDTPTLVNLKEQGIIDPTKVIRVALESAVSVINLLLTSDNVIVRIEKPQPLQLTASPIMG